jgi:hypothetical protein
VKSLTKLEFSKEELAQIQDILRGAKTFVKLPPHRKPATSKNIVRR